MLATEARACWLAMLVLIYQGFHSPLTSLQNRFSGTGDPLKVAFTVRLPLSLGQDKFVMPGDSEPVFVASMVD